MCRVKWKIHVQVVVRTSVSRTGKGNGNQGSIDAYLSRNFPYISTRNMYV